MMNLVNDREFESTLKDLEAYVCHSFTAPAPVREAVSLVTRSMREVLNHSNGSDIIETDTHVSIFDGLVVLCGDARDYVYDCHTRGITVDAAELFSMACRIADDTTSFTTQVQECI